MREHPETNKYELLNSSPERVYDFYINLNDENVLFYADVIVSKETESALLSKDEPLITLALARYCIHRETLVAVFKGAMDKNQVALRLACLNRIQKISYDSYSMRLPYCLFESTRRRGDMGDDICADEGNCNQEIVNWLSTAEHDEIAALFENENISDVFLYKFFNQEKYWHALASRTDQKSLIQDAFYFIKENKKIHKGEYLHRDYIQKACDLPKKVEPTLKLARALSGLYEKLERSAFGGIDSSIIEKWMIDDDEKGFGYELGPYATLRIYLYNVHHLKKYDLTSNDIAYRCAQYLFCKFNHSVRNAIFQDKEEWPSLTPDCIYEAFEKDGITACTYLIKNESLWRYKATREALAKVWGKLGYNEKEYVFPSFWDLWNGYEKSHPEWFNEFDPDKRDIRDMNVRDLKDLLDDFKDQTVRETSNQIYDYLLTALDVIKNR
jgi:hypothetical protein